MSGEACTSSRSTQTLWQLRNSKAQKEGLHATVYLASGEHYKGEWHDNQRHGKGVVTYKNGDKYEGDWADGVRHGSGTLWVLRHGKYHVRYSGDWAEDLPEGSGTFHDDAGNSYEGDWRAGLRHGQGRAVMGSTAGGGGSEVYEGQWQHDRRHGNGTLMLANGDLYEGQWEADVKHGHGTHFFMAKGCRYDGVWSNGVAKAGSYSEVAPAPPGAPGALPNLELAEPAAVLAGAAADALGGSRGECDGPAVL